MTLGRLRISATAALVVGLCTILAASTVLFLASREADPVAATLGDGELRSIVPDVSSVPLRRTASVTVTGEAASALRPAPGLAGMVTASPLAPGDEVTSGTPVVEVDGTTVLALHTPAPLHRTIGPETTGADVAMLGTALVNLGLMEPAAVDEVPNADLLAAINAFHRAHRDPRTDALAFEPSWVTWLPHERVVVTRIAVRVGSTVSDPIAETSSTDRAIEVLDDAGGAIPPDQWPSLRIEAIDGAAPPLQVTMADLARRPDLLAPRDAPASPEGEPSDQPSEGRVVRVAYSGAESVRGSVVPLTAVLGMPGSECVVTTAASGSRTVTVEVAGETGGRPVVTGLEPDVAILVAPDPLAHECPRGAP